MAQPTNSLEWIVYLAENYSNMFIQGTLLTLYISILGTILGFILGYVSGIIQDIQIRPADNPVKKLLLRIIKIIFYRLCGTVPGNAHESYRR